jgi:hypothetical protein
MIRTRRVAEEIHIHHVKPPHMSPNRAERRGEERRGEASTKADVVGILMSVGTLLRSGLVGTRAAA